MISFITYISSASENIDPSDLKSICEKSRINNRKNGITGLLLYVEGDFIQTIEGAHAEVKKLYEKILIDKRHKSVIQVFSGETKERQFGKWAMSGISLSYKDISAMDGFEAYNRGILFDIENSEARHPAIKIMEAITPKLNSFIGI